MREPILKSQPTLADVHIDQALTNISVAYMQSNDTFVASKVFPVIPVDKQTNKYFTFPKEAWFKDEARKRTDGTETAGSGYTVSTDSYSCDVWGFHKDLGAQLRANADAQINLERGAVQFVTQRMLMRQELQWVADYFVGSIWGTTVTGATNFVRWSDYINSDPVEDIENAKETILSTTGFMPNTIVMGYQVWRKLKNHPDIYDRLKGAGGAGPRTITKQQVAAIFEVDNIYVPQGIQATNVEGETAAWSFLQGKHLWIGYVNPSPGMEMPSAGYTFHWTGISGGLGSAIAIDSYEIRTLKTIRYEAEMAFDNKLVAADLGYFMSGVVV